MTGTRPWWRGAALFAAYLGIATALRLPAFFVSVIDWDESLYLLVAQSVLAGDLPYVRVWDHKQPSIFYVFALAQGLLGNGVFSIRVLGVVCVATSATLLHRFVLQILSDDPPKLKPSIGWFAGLSYLAQSAINGGLASNTEIVFGTFSLIGFVCLENALRLVDESTPSAPRRERGWLLAAGAAVGFAFSIKLVVGVEVVALALFYLLRRHGQGRLSWPRFWREGGLMAGSFLAMNAIVLVPHVAAGQGSLLYASVVEYNTQYASGGVSSTRVANALTSLLTLFPAVAIALVPLAAFPSVVGSATRARVGAVYCWWLLTLIACVLQGKLFPHHFQQTMLPFSLLFAVGASVLLRPLSNGGAWVAASTGALLLFMGLAPPLFRLQLHHQALLRGIAHGDPQEYDAPAKVADMIVSASGRGASVYVFDSQPIIYALAGTTSPTRFPFPLHLLGTNRGFGDLDQTAEIQRVLAGRPEWVVVESLDRPPGKAELVAEALASEYAEFAQVPIMVRDERHFAGLVYRAMDSGRSITLYRLASR